MSRFDRRVAVVTGPSSGIGRARGFTEALRIEMLAGGDPCKRMTWSERR